MPADLAFELLLYLGLIYFVAMLAWIRWKSGWERYGPLALAVLATFYILLLDGIQPWHGEPLATYSERISVDHT